MTVEQANDPAAFHEFELNGWQGAADGYNRHWVSLTDQAGPFLLDAVNASTGSAVLDVASGPGGVSALAVSRGAVVTGLDFSPEMVAIATKRFPDVTFVEGDAENMPFADGSFDAVVMNFGMLHLPSPVNAIAEAFRVLRPGGHFGFTVWATPAEAKGFALTLEAVRLHGAAATVPHGPDFFTFADASTAAAVLQEAGFVEPTTSTLPMTWHLKAPADVFTAFFEGTARTGALLRQQDQAAQKRIAESIAASAAAFSTSDGGVDIPMPARMSTARKS